MSPKGGKREGAGKPALYGKAMKRVNVMLDRETIEFYTKQGKGNLSEGIRQYWRSPTQRALDVCPACAGKGTVKIGVYSETCSACHGTGTRQ